MITVVLTLILVWGSFPAFVMVEVLGGKQWKKGDYLLPVVIVLFKDYNLKNQMVCSVER